MIRPCEIPCEPHLYTSVFYKAVKIGSIGSDQFTVENARHVLTWTRAHLPNMLMSQAKLARLKFNLKPGAEAAAELLKGAHSFDLHGEHAEALELRKLAAMCT